jgi:hypothetical protein
MVWPRALLLAILLHGADAGDPVRSTLAIDPPVLRLAGPGAAWSLLVNGSEPGGRPVDRTGRSTFRSRNPAVVTVDASGRVRAVATGTTTIEAEAAGQRAVIAVTVADSARPRPFHFETDVEPLLGRYGCNSSGCHGKAEGQGGFKLSVFASDPRADFAAIVKEARGRRVFPAAPAASLLLRKAAGLTPHGGGTRLAAASEDWAALRAWVAAGTPYGAADAPRVVGLRIEPSDRVLAMRAEQRLRVVARYSDGREEDVTRHARFQANNEEIAAVSADGTVTTRTAPGEVAVMASYLGEVGLFRAVVPRPGSAVVNGLPQFNRIDELIDAKLARLNIAPSAVCDDAEFLRRAYLDLTGTLPTPADVRRFLADDAPNRRAKLIDALLLRPEFADLWALRWADLLRVDRQALGHQRAYAFYKWIRDAVASNKPLDQFARELVAAEGPLPETGPANFYAAVTKPGAMASTLSQVFLGVRIACAECHHHPFDRWSQDDYAGMVAFFAPVVARTSPAGAAVFARGEPTAKQPRTGAVIHARPLGGAASGATSGDARAALADWMTRTDNPYFARNLANRTWAWLMGRGLVEPVDDVRSTNPPSNPELLDELAAQLVRSGYDTRALIKLITASRAYQTSSRPNDTNERDEQNFSRALLRRPDAEVLFDMVCQATGVPETFGGSPTATRATQLWDSKVRHDFLKLFGRPARVSACACERSREPSVAQVLHLLNAPAVQAKLSHEAGTVARLVRTVSDDGQLTDELYLTFFARLPSEPERAAAIAYLSRDPAKRRQAAEDLAWSLLNSLEFLFNH